MVSILNVEVRSGTTIQSKLNSGMYCHQLADGNAFIYTILRLVDGN